MGIKRIVNTDFWTDDKVVDLFSPEDKLFFLYLITNPHTTQLGIYHVPKKVMAFEIGYSTDAIEVLLDRFENKYGLIKYSSGTSELAIRNYLLHSIAKGGKPVEDLLIKEIQQVKNKELLSYVYAALSSKEILNQSVLNILPLLNENDNENENENEESLYDSSHDSSKKKKHKYGEYKNVLLTDDELKKLQSQYPDWEDKITELDEAIERKGYKYKSHYLTILKWARDNESQQTGGLPYL